LITRYSYTMRILRKGRTCLCNLWSPLCLMGLLAVLCMRSLLSEVPRTLLIGMITQPHLFGRRSLIRMTYMREKPTNIKLMFCMGRPTKKSASTLLQLESQLFNDIVILDVDEDELTVVPYNIRVSLKQKLLHFCSTSLDIINRIS
jgi:hypothetical protein